MRFRASKFSEGKDAKIRNSSQISCKKNRIYLALAMGVGVILLSILFAPLSSSAEANLSISGTTFLDLNSDMKKDTSEPGLEGCIIYIDLNNNSQWEPTERNETTNQQGKYTFSNVSRKTYVIRELISSGQLQLSHPKSGYYFIDLESPSAMPYIDADFGHTIKTPIENSAIPEWPYQLIIIIIGFVAILIIGGGLLILRQSLSKLKSLKVDKNEDRNTLIQIVSGFVLLFSGLYLLIDLSQQSRNLINSSSIDYSSGSSIIIPVILGLLIFGAVLLMCRMNANQHEKGSMRRMISGILVIGLLGVILFSLSGVIKNGMCLAGQLLG